MSWFRHDFIWWVYSKLKNLSKKRQSLFKFFESKSTKLSDTRVCVIVNEIDVLNELLHNSMVFCLQKYEIGLFHQECRLSVQRLINAYVIRICFAFSRNFWSQSGACAWHNEGITRRIQGVRALLRVPRNACYTRGRRTRRGQGYTEGAAKSLPNGEHSILLWGNLRGFVMKVFDFFAYSWRWIGLV